MEIIDKIDETIISVCENIKEGNYTNNNYAETVKALAELLKARAEYIN